jgi:predicted dehydrogenase
MTGSKIKLGIIGTGEVIRGAYLPTFPFLDELEEVHLFDISDLAPKRLMEEYLKELEQKFYLEYSGAFSNVQEKAQAFAKKFKVHNSLNSLLSVTTHVFVASTPNTHANIAIQCLDGKHIVLLEKPLDISSDKVTDLMKKSEEFPGALRYVENFIFNPVYELIKKRIDQDEIGDIISIKTFLSNTMPKEGTWRYNPAISGGGVLFDWAPHTIGLTFFIAGPEYFLKSYNVVDERRLDSGLDVYQLSKLVLSNASGNIISAVIENSWECNGKLDTEGGKYCVIIEGIRGTFEIRLMKVEGKKVYRVTKKMNREDPQIEIVPVLFPHDSYYFAVKEAMLMNNTRFKPFVDPKFGLYVMETIWNLAKERK